MGASRSAGVSYGVEGKFSYSQVGSGIATEIIFRYMLQVMQGKMIGKTNTTVDENGKFSYFSADMRPVPPGMVQHRFVRRTL